MKTTYEVYYVGRADPEVHEVDWPKEPTLAMINALVDPLIGGEPMEHVTLLHAGERRDMFVSEIGNMYLTTRDPLPINDAATAIYRHYWLRQHPGTNPDTLPDIHGTAVLFVNRIVWH